MPSETDVPKLKPVVKSPKFILAEQFLNSADDLKILSWGEEGERNAKILEQKAIKLIEKEAIKTG